MLALTVSVEAPPGCVQALFASACSSSRVGFPSSRLPEQVLRSALGCNLLSLFVGERCDLNSSEQFFKLSKF